MSAPGFSELILLFVIGLMILGPERLPRVASQLGRWIGKARRTANQLRFQMEREIALAELDRKKPKPPPSDHSDTSDGASAPESTEADAESESAMSESPPPPGDTSAAKTAATAGTAGSSAVDQSGDDSSAPAHSVDDKL
jgi:sec-independent protein translocase protein TatB